MADDSSIEKKCFVISPIGPTGSEIREHADDVFEFIIAPAAKRAKYEAHRGDHNSRPGKISDQMFSNILTDPIIIAVLNFDNSNVFYELAIAHAAARPLIILCEKNQVLPFDIKDHRVIYYDLRPRPIVQKLYQDELVKAILELENIEKDIDVPFGRDLVPLGGRGLGAGFKVYNKMIEAVTGGSFPHSIIQSARTLIRFSGMTLRSLDTLAGFETMISSAISRGCAVEAFLMDEQNVALPHMLKDDTYLDEVQRTISGSWERWKAIASKYQGVRAWKVKHGMILHQVTMNEQQLLLIPYWNSIFPNEAPAVAVTDESPFYRAVQSEYESLKMRNEGIGQA